MYRTILLLWCVAVIGNAETANSEHVRELPSLEITEAPIPESGIVADHLELNSEDRQIPGRIAADEQLSLLRREALLFPADELYNSHWDNRHVNPFRKTDIEFPDTCAIDCSLFVFPLSSETYRISSRYGMRRRRMHYGIDLAVGKGDTIRAAFDGKVRIRAYERYGFGNYLVIRHPNGLETVYGHLSAFFVKENDIVYAGTPIALSGNTGRSTGSHLHFEIRFLGLALNPEDVIDFENKAPHTDVFIFNHSQSFSDSEPIYHRLKAGDTLSVLARRYGTTVRRLCELNNIKQTTILRVGQTIRCS